MLSCAVFTIFLTIVLSYTGYTLYRSDMFGRYEAYAKTLLNLTKSTISVTSIKDKISKQEEDISFHQTQSMMNTIKENANIQYIYMVYFQEDTGNQMYYITNGYTAKQKKEHPETINYVGQKADDFPKNMVDTFYEAYKTGKKGTFFIDNETDQSEYVRTAWSPIIDEDGKTVCIVCVDILVKDIHDKLMDYQKAVAIEAAIIGGIFLFLFSLVLQLKVVRPVNKIALSAQNFAKQSHEVLEPMALTFEPVIVKSRDEIQMLSDSLTTMVEEMKRYMVEISKLATEKERMDVQMQIVKQIKKNLFPFVYPSFPERKEIDVYANIQFSNQDGGDFFNFFFVDKTHICFFVGSASGVGLPTTMVAVITTILMENFAKLSYEPGRILRETNNQLSQNTDTNITVETFLGICNLENGILEYASAGEICPIIKCSGKEMEPLPCKSGFRIGSMEHMPYVTEQKKLVQGDLLFLYTKGVPDVVDERGNRYSEECLIETVSSITKEEYEIEKIGESILTELNRFAGGKEQAKEETILLVRVAPYR